MRRPADYVIHYSFKLSRYNKRGWRNVNKQSKRIWYAFKRFRTNQNEIKHKNEQDKETLWIKRKESIKNNIMNDDDKVFQFNQTRDLL